MPQHESPPHESPQLQGVSLEPPAAPNPAERMRFAFLSNCLTGARAYREKFLAWFLPGHRKALPQIQKAAQVAWRKTGQGIKALIRWLKERVKCDIPDLASLPEAPLPDALPKYLLAPNWKTSAHEARLPHYLVRDHGKQVEEVVTRFLQRLHREHLPGTSAAWAEELQNSAGTERPLRLVHRHGEGHLSATDVVFKSEGSDLYVRFESLPRTLLRLLKWGWYGMMFLVLFTLLATIYFSNFNGWQSWVADYAQKYGRVEHQDADKGTFLEKKLMEGYHATDWRAFHFALAEREDVLARIREYFSSIKVDALNSRAGYADPKRAGEPVAFSTGCGVLFKVQLSKGQFSDLWGYFSSGRRFELMGGNKGEAATETVFAIDMLMIFALSLHDQHDHYVLNDMSMPQIVSGGWMAGQMVLRPLHSTQVLDGAFYDVRVAAGILDGVPGFEKEQAAIYELLNKHTEWVKPVSARALFFKDPRLGSLHLGLPTGIIAALVGLALKRVPKAWLRFPCRRLGWPTPEDYNNRVEAKSGWVERVLSDTLKDEFGVTKQDVIDLRR